MKNLMIIGASGHVSNAVLHNLIHHRHLFKKLVLVDKNKKLLQDPYINHKELRYVFIHKKIYPEKREQDYKNILKKYKIDIAIDLTDAETVPLIETTDKEGVDYINTAMNSEKINVYELMQEIFNRKKEFTHARHILCTGMNPGVVNMWVRYGIEKFGIPKEVVHFEYDTSIFSKKIKPMVTWSIHEFLVENIRDPGGLMKKRDKEQILYPNAMKNTVYMEPILKPIMKLKKYPYGSEVLHEENVSISQKYNVPSKFIYSVNDITMQFLRKVYKNKKNVLRKDLMLGDNLKYHLDGADSIGVYLDYKDKRVYYFNTIPNISVIGTSATYLQVSVGIFAALFTLLNNKLLKGIYFVEDLFHSSFKHYLFDNMRVQEFIFKKDGKLKLASYTPMIKMKEPMTERAYI